MKQRDMIKKLFEDRPNQWIPLTEILRMGIAQYGARILELRRQGMIIENKWQFINGQKHSWFKFAKDKQQELFA